MKIKLLVVLLFVNLFNVNAQDVYGIITYKVSVKDFKSREIYNKDSIKNHSTEVFYKRYKEILKKAKNINSQLIFNKKISVYKNFENIKINENERSNLTYLLSGSGRKYYTKRGVLNYESTVLDCELLGECFLVETKLPKWELYPQTKMINGFLCYKAILNNQKKSLEAWYAPKLPYSYGIMSYYGLPGVVLEINEKMFTITAIKVELNPLEEKEIKEPKNIKKISSKEFEKMKKKYFPMFYKT